MLIQSSLSNSISKELAFVSDHGKQRSMGLSCDWSHWDKSSNDEFALQNSAKSICSSEEISKISSPVIVEIPNTSPDLVVVKRMCPNFASTWDGLVYKRRRLRRNTITLLSDGKTTECDQGLNGSNANIISTGHPLTPCKHALPEELALTVYVSSGQSLDSGNSSVSRRNHLQESLTFPSPQINEAEKITALSESVQKDRLLVKEAAFPPETTISNHFKSTSENCLLMHTSSSSSKTDSRQDLAVTKARADCGECSSSDVIATEPFDEFTSVKELCISVLKRHGLLVEVKRRGACGPLEDRNVNNASISRSCKSCNLLENPLKMLICDLCEEAFHVSCCIPKVKKIPMDYWYCQPCVKKSPKAFLEESSKKSAIVLLAHRHKKFHGKGGPILNMLRDNHPYASEIRIGKAFQAEVPPWTGPISEESNYFDVDLEVDLANGASLVVPDAETSSKFNCIGNWIQCRKVTYKNKKRTICGKWRRSPLFVVQTDNWDCSCSVLWDPIHADCVVPQELETDVILEHLKYVEMLRGRLTFNPADT